MKYQTASGIRKTNDNVRKIPEQLNQVNQAAYQ